MTKCKNCGGTGKIALFTSVVDCDCVLPPKSNTCLSTDRPQNFPKDSNIHNGWYSPSFRAKHGYVIYEHAKTGKEIMITEISTKETPHCNHPDTKFVGTINKDRYVRGGIN